MSTQLSVHSELRTPTCIEDVTAAWMTAVMAATRPGVVVTRCEVVDVIWGNAAKARFSLAYNRAGEAAGLPPSVIVKGSLGGHPDSHEWNYSIEVWAYRHVLPHLRVNTPHCYYAGVDAAGRSVMVLEDLALRNVRFCRVLEPINYAETARFLDAYAHLHAQWWGSPELEPGGRFDFLALTMDRSEVGVGNWIDHCLRPENWNAVMQLPRAVAMPRSLRDRSRISEAFDKLTVLWSTGPLCINHGDEHLDNVFIEPDGKPGFFDLQSKRAPWHLSFAYFLGGALDIDDRRRWEQPLLASYLERLAVYGVKQPPTFDDAWLAYRRSLIFGYFIWLNNPVTAQPEEKNTANTSRFGMALLDHRSLDLL